ncbi:hypothetical protein C5167_046388 [Papaver somniferum]|uniref:Uncharacterized protein n=1 Tax=Papaver somniferum TaxID=3469 RepID=A0A4Y7LDM8_PAPSO|nr:hypothetical protein C5167_046388 [Papaver somniferum]
MQPTYVFYSFNLCIIKSAWPELIGYNGEAAARIIERQFNVNAVVLLDGTDITKEYYECNDGLVWVDEAGKVIRTPTIG